MPALMDSSTSKTSSQTKTIMEYVGPIETRYSEKVFTKLLRIYPSVAGKNSGEQTGAAPMSKAKA